jgi:hypothetical protein
VTLRFQAEGYRVKALTRSKASLEKEVKCYHCVLCHHLDFTTIITTTQGFCSPVIIDAADEVIVADVTKPDTLKVDVTATTTALLVSSRPFIGPSRHSFFPPSFLPSLLFKGVFAGADVGTCCLAIEY